MSPREIKLVECLDWPVENGLEGVAQQAEKLKTSNVELDALWFYDSAGKNKIAAIAKKPAQLKRVLQAMGVRPNVSECVYVCGQDQAGVLVQAWHKLVSSGIEVVCSDAIASQGKYGAIFWVAENDMKRAKHLLQG